MIRKAYNQHLKELLLLLSVPIAIILVIVAFVYVPRLFANPTYDFIYCDGYSCDRRYTIDSSNRISVPPGVDHRSYSEATLRYYDVDRDASRPISMGEAAEYQLDPMSKSPDGYTLEHNSSGGGFLLWSDYSSSWSLSKGIISKPVSFGDSRYDKQFIGWVLR